MGYIFEKISYFLIIVISLFILSSCGETNIPPSIPSNPEPANGKTSVPLNPVLSLYTFDEENDEILSYLYFGVMRNLMQNLNQVVIYSIFFL
ncbi:hypothetical protein H17ap60334_07788 [Thermosipho africanus H17ap60334]|uniref:hypothetical protein n=1 Tax=Thermosipho africanus TaxID=2421 RepID=UPI00028C6ED2|nr:hypothetical protein [Thermosipho africanus]EKF49040.1 hypothetical protein H17ap60334_07788 [Thermosipho africanus H17ap60334]MDN5324772.1 hypothetical protein [Thermosipho sp. (in: thermotogales)]